jgi:hypothetical protein
MSHAYDTRTFTVSSEEVPSTFASLEDFQNFKTEAGGKAHARTDALHYVWGSTRSGWAIYLMRNLLDSAPDYPALQFLTDKGHTHTFETEYGSTSVSMLDATGVAAAVAQFDGLLSSMKEAPDRVYEADHGGIFSDQDVETAAARDYVSAKPAYDDQVWGDEGQSADYLFTYLRSVLAVLRSAQEQGLSVVHVMVI